MQDYLHTDKKEYFSFNNNNFTPIHQNNFSSRFL